jgi:hypothetical protein
MPDVDTVSLLLDIEKQFGSVITRIALDTFL